MTNFGQSLDSTFSHLLVLAMNRPPSVQTFHNDAEDSLWQYQVRRPESGAVVVVRAVD